jgi:hypothetical protein
MWPHPHSYFIPFLFGTIFSFFYESEIFREIFLCIEGPDTLSMKTIEAVVELKEL